MRAQKMGLILSFLFFMFGTAAAQSVEQSFHVADISVDEFLPQAAGTFVLKDIQTGEIFIYNKGRAEKRQAPNSTFKIMNALIGLQTKAVQDEYDVKRWDGITRSVSVWNKDHVLASGMRYSVVWYYQAMARDIGETRMQEWLDRCSYGNRDISGGIDRFWLNSSLKISPLEQVDFIEHLYRETLPFDKNVMKTVKRIMIQQEGDDYTLYGKTGSSGLVDTLATGWFVGFVTVKGHPYVFATNLDTQEDSAGQAAKRTTLNILQKYKLIDQ